MDDPTALPIQAMFARTTVYHRPGYQPYSGREEVFWFYQRDRIIASGAHQIEQAVADDHQVAVHGRFTGLLHDGTAVDLRFADFFSFDRSDLVCERRTFYFTHTV